MKIIVQIYKKLLGFFRTDKKITDENKTINSETYIGSLSFSITNNREIDITCTFPDLTNKSSENIKDLSEIYAEFLVYINEGLLRDDILQMIENKDHSKNLTEDQQAKDRFFIDNVVFNWALLHVENINRKKHSKKETQPLIRPITVFNPV